MSESDNLPITEKNDIYLLFGMVMAFGATEEIDLECTDSSNESEASLPKSIEAADDGHQNTLGVKTFVKDKAIEMYAKKAMENLKKTLQSSEPLVIGTVNKETVKDKDFNLTFGINNVKVYNLGALQVKKFKSVSEKNMVEFAFAVPFLKLKGNYEVNGTFQQKKIQGKGDSEIQINNVSIDNGQISIKETPQEIQIQDLSFCYAFKDMSIKQSGLNIEGVPPDNVTNMLLTIATKYLKDQRQKICKMVAADIKARANAKLKGKTREQLGDMMK